MPKPLGNAPFSGEASTTTKEGIVRVRLLAELSTLREKHNKLLAERLEPERHHSPSAGSSCEDNGTGQSPFLGKADRDAIEAFFSNSEDDFTRQFNEGLGKLQRGELLDKIARPPQ
ncbi:hypothetical protein DQ04_00601000 [Trypanosoma grayi]|uniref:hypothetical protein n=1 Tax=Trypanosoma grayi TaxID=71804 RepID=UPI0004F43A6A|nr:hypothetical protein DQ04_00601000 [Trypanosoma grayi]KEG14133.1 hypothetical protein DQ04_00601000 [Trypanosoma grayi]